MQRRLFGISLRRWLGLVVLLCLLLAGVQLALAARDTVAGREALAAAEAAARARDFPAVEQHLAAAHDHLGSARGHVNGAGPVVWLARVTPYVRKQIGALDAVLAAGDTAATAGLEVLPSITAATEPQGDGQVQKALTELSRTAPELRAAVEQLQAARERVGEYDGYQLLGPLATAQREASSRLEEAVDLATRGERALTVVLSLTGAEGPRRFLLLSQNPDEPRPTGGYIGTYGVLESAGGEIDLARYGAMGDWHTAHPEAAIPSEQAPFALAWSSTPQGLGNVNTTPDWPASAELASQLWERGGQEAVDGVITYLPGLIGRLLEALGPVEVPSYGETVTSANLDERLEFHTHGEFSRGLPSGVRKAFIGELAEQVVSRAKAMPADRLPEMAEALSEGLDAGELAVWSARPPVQEALTELAWDGAFRGADGDAFMEASFAFASKNGRGIQRTYDHVASLRPDGSGTSDTVLTVKNTLPFEPGYNPGTYAYLTPYGPRGAVLAASSPEPVWDEPSLDGHPTAGWLLDAPPLGSAKLQVTWDAPALAIPVGPGEWEYRLTWRPTPGHVGDVLNIDIRLPEGWRWAAEAPPATVALDGPFTGGWKIIQSGDAE